jgi:hypothetical protein
MVKKQMTRKAISKEITNLFNSYIQRRYLRDDLTEISKRLRAAVDSGDKININTLQKRHKELCKRVAGLSTKKINDALYMQFPLPENFRLKNGVSVQQLTQGVCFPVITQFSIFPTDLGSTINDENVSGQSKASGNSELLLNNTMVWLSAKLTDDATPDPVPHLETDAFSVIHQLEINFPAPLVDSLLLWRFETYCESSFTQGAYSGNELMSVGAIGFPTGSLDIFRWILGPFVALESSSDSHDLRKSGIQVLWNTMNVSAGVSAKLWIYFSINLRALYGTVESQGGIFFNDGYGGYGSISYYFI